MLEIYELSISMRIHAAFRTRCSWRLQPDQGPQRRRPPPYAILGEQVTFRDLEGTGKSKPGYKKIRFCGEVSRRDSMQYPWDDKCCIDKSNSTELAEAINSVFTGTDP